MKTIQQIDIMSAAKIQAVLAAVFGFIAGIFIAMGSVLGAVFGASQEAGVVGVIFGVGAFIFLPVIYGVIGFVAGALSAWMYNLVASKIGGIRIQLD